MSLFESIQFGVITALPIETIALQQTCGPFLPMPLGSRRIPYNVSVFHLMTARQKALPIAHVEVLDMGNSSGAVAGAILGVLFPALEYVIVCGIAGGCPINLGQETRPLSDKEFESHPQVGDTVISLDGLIQYDNIKLLENNEVVHRHIPFRAPALFKQAMSQILIDTDRGLFSLGKEVCSVLDRNGIEAPKFSSYGDFFPRYADRKGEVHKSAKPQKVPKTRLLQKARPHILTGSIGSANVLMRDFRRRDALKSRFDILAVEMEGSGVSDAAWTFNRSSVAIRGIADYADMDKDDRFHRYAATSAACTLKSLIQRIPI